jgi:glycerol-3-phosphate dehydrogenase
MRVPATPDYDIFVIGGGINGCGIARDAAGRGFSTGLAEMADLASGTSSWSTKLIHGGLRYLEHYEFRLVRESLEERERLWASAPHIIRPMRFVLPHHAGLRPAWLLRLGLLLYDHLGGRKLLPKTRTLDLRSDPAGRPLKPGFGRAFEYSDCAVDDCRLVVLNAMDAAARGAAISTRTKVVAAERRDGRWAIELEDQRGGGRRRATARLLVNAAGPWVDRVLDGTLGETGARHVRLVQGSHIVVRQKFADPRAYFFQTADGRIIFAIPYQDDFTLIGTTDRDYDGDPSKAAANEAEVGYLCAAASEYFAEPVRREDVVWSFSGVRPLYDDGASKAQEATRDYVLRVEGDGEAPPLLNVFGGKLTTYRRLAEAVMERVEGRLGKRGARWTADATLPGGDFPVTGFEAAVADFAAARPWLAPSDARRLFRLYGTCAAEVVGDAKRPEDLGRDFGAGLREAEVDYLVRREWAQTADDVLWRRTKLGLRLSPEAARSLDGHLAAVLGPVAAE